MDDPQVKHRNLIATYEHPRAGTVKVIGPAVQLSATPPAIDRPAPIIGQHSEEILREFGVSEAVIDDLRERHLIEQGEV